MAGLTRAACNWLSERVDESDETTAELSIFSKDILETPLERSITSVKSETCATSFEGAEEVAWELDSLAQSSFRSS